MNRVNKYEVKAYRTYKTWTKVKAAVSLSLNNVWKRPSICCAVGLWFDRHYPLTQTSLSVAEDICNCCQGPINHPVSKRPCNAFWISTYVESEAVCQQAEPLRGKRGWSRLGAGVGSHSNVDHMWAVRRTRRRWALLTLLIWAPKEIWSWRMDIFY